MTRHLGGLLFWLGLVVCLGLAMAGCGGGVDVDQAQPQAARAPVRVALIGDSTQQGLDGLFEPDNGRLVPHAPGVELQADMDACFGPGAVIVTNYAVSGTTALQAPRVHADVVVANYGINDMRLGESPAQFADAMRATGATLIETQNPIVDRKWPESDFVDAAKGLGLPVADVNAYVLTLPNWQAQEGTIGVHPSDALYRLIVDNVLAPAVAAQVRRVLR